jgi:hypothetical protein
MDTNKHELRRQMIYKRTADCPDGADESPRITLINANIKQVVAKVSKDYADAQRNETAAKRIVNR